MDTFVFALWVAAGIGLALSILGVRFQDKSGAFSPQAGMLVLMMFLTTVLIVFAGGTSVYAAMSEYADAFRISAAAFTYLVLAVIATAVWKKWIV